MSIRCAWLIVVFACEAYPQNVSMADSFGTTISLTVPKTVYYEDNWDAFHGQAMRDGEPVRLRATLDDTSYELEPCPTLLLRVRLPDGSVRVQSPQYTPRCTRFPDLPGKVIVDINAGSASWWNIGDRIGIAVLHRAETGEIIEESNEVSIEIADAAKIERKWGPIENGVSVDVTLDKETYALGEDVPLHIALENFSADVPIVSDSPLWRPFQLIKIDLRDASGQPAPVTCMTAFIGSWPGFYRYPKGMVVPIERSLERQAILPDYSGTFTVQVTWAPFAGTDDTCTLCELPEGFDVTKPYVVAHSQLVHFTIAGSAKRPIRPPNAPLPQCW